MQTDLKKQIFIASLIYVGQLIVGMSLGWSAPVIPKLQDPDQTPLPEVITEAQAAWIGSITFIGTITGPYIGSYVSNSKGRRPCLFLGALTSVISFIMAALAKDLYLLYAARIIMGIGTGTIFVTNLVYLGEIASTHVRGIFLTMTACFNTGGTFLVYLIAPYVSYAATSWIGFGISIAFLGSIFYLPESPVFYAFNGNEAKAQETLKYLGRENEIKNIKSKTEEKPISSKIDEWIEIFTIKSNRQALFITLTLTILQQSSGIMAVIFFTTTIFELAGSSIQPHIATIIVGLTQVVASLITPWFVERIGRKSLLLFSTAFTSLSMAVMGIYFFLDRIEHASVANIGWLPLVSLIVCFLAFDLGFGIIPGTLTGEMFRANVRSTGSTLTITISWLFGFGITTAFGYMVPSIGPDFTFWIYAGITACAFFFSLFFVPETKGKTLLEIEEMLSREK